MGKREPNGAELKRARSSRIQHPAGHVEVRLGVAVIERVAALMKPRYRRYAQESQQYERNQQLKNW
jgi:hypothetical protein